MPGVGDAGLELVEIAAGGGEARRRGEDRRIGAIGGVGVAAIAVVATLFATRGSRSRDSMEAPSLRLTQLTSSEGVEQFPAWSPDGASVVYSGEVGGIRKLFVKWIGEADAQQLTTGD